jgi:hypothetical protein
MPSKDASESGLVCASGSASAAATVENEDDEIL